MTLHSQAIPRDDFLLPLWRRQVEENPGTVAVVFGARSLTYAELDRLSDHLANRLLDLGMRANDCVGICLERSLDVPVAVLATLKAGGAYLPLDPHYPRDRLAFMLEDGDVRALLTQRALKDLLLSEPERTLCLDDESYGADKTHNAPFSPATGEPTDLLAYVIYTSGSTGRPKGVALGRAALANLIRWQVGNSIAGAGTRTLQYTPLSFDVHFQELFGTWAAGGTLVLVPDEVRLDPLRLLPFLEEQRIDRLFLPFIALQSLAEVARARSLYPSCLREVITAGEQLQITTAVADLFAHLPDCTLHNHYGPSETHVVTAHTLTGPPATWPTLPSIGVPLPGVEIVLFDKQGRAETGELFIGGVALARGYHRRPELTAERFVGRDGRRMYRTGDLARRLPDGSYEYLGRIDGQVKIRGHRVELGEVEVALSAHPDVLQAAVTIQEGAPGNKHLVACVVPREGAEFDAASLRGFLAERLPEYMVPAYFLRVAELPRTPSGKVDRRALPTPALTRPELASEYIEPRPGLEETLAGIWRDLLRLDRVGSHDAFFELGGNSLLSVQMLTRFHEKTGLDVPLATFFRFPTIARLAGEYSVLSTQYSVPSTQYPAPSTQYLVPSTQHLVAGRSKAGAIAVVGMAGRFPGANNVGQLWRNLCAGVDSITFFTDGELDPAVTDELRRDPTYVKARGVLDNVEDFDAAFFGVSPREAEVMDPQQRLFLETAWEALEHAGTVPEHFRGRIGVYAGAHNNSYFPAFVARRPDLSARFGEFQTMLANEKDYLATRTAYALNLNGPAVSLNTACSTSLVAVVQAVHSLLGGQCDLALAGGVTVICPQKSGYLSQDGGMLSPDGHCRSFDAAASGTLFSNGVGVVALKRLDDALADGDTVYAVLRGAALNNDGARKVSFTAPAVDGQAEVVALAQALAGFAPDSISYVEAHGTATPLGDPVEVEALTRAFRAGTNQKQFCALGSIKGNFGHLVSAAGVAGLIKTVLALHHEQLPPTLHFHTPNPRIDWANSPFRVVDRLISWPRGDRPRRAAVSSFGVGGTNAHVVLEEAPARATAESEQPSEQLLLLSARTEAALTQATRNLADYFADSPASLADVAFTLQKGRRSFAHRRIVVARAAAAAVEALRDPQSRPLWTRHCVAAAADVVFLFPGQGTQYSGMGRELYQRETVFRTEFDRCAEIVSPALGRDLRDVVFSGEDGSLDQTRFAQPALFAFGYALARQWQSWGVQPRALLGHSVGEFVAACLAEVFSVDDGLRLVARRAEMMQARPTGGMLSVRWPAERLQAWLDDSCAVASVNAPSLCVVSGPEVSLTRIEGLCDREQVVYRRLRTSHAFHSPMMDAVVAPFTEAVRAVRLAPPRLPILSTVTATWLTAEQATDPAYWAGHLRATVRFGDALAAVVKELKPVLLEVGPRNTLATLARQQVSERGAVIASLEESKNGTEEKAALLQAAGRLWLAGASLDWDRLHEQKRRRVPLPTYPFQRQRYWADAVPTNLAVTGPERERGVVIPSLALGAGKDLKLAKPSEGATMPSARKPRLLDELREMFEESSGLDLPPDSTGHTFFELGLDSLFLTQACLMVQRKYQVPLTFRQLMEDLCSPDRLADYLDQRLPTETPAPAVAAKANGVAVSLFAAPPPHPTARPESSVAEGVQQLIAQQLQIMARQLELLGAASSVPAPMAAIEKNGVAHGPAKAETPLAAPKSFGAAARITLKQEGLSAGQKEALADITQRYTARTKSSKELTQRSRAVLADPRVVSGFRPETKELVYPIVIKHSRGCKLTDLDGNEYVDLTCGFGSNFFGFGPPFIADAVAAQLREGYEIGPQHPLAGEVAAKISRFVGLPRVVFCNTGSEAVLGALRLARTVTGRNTVALFNGSYHGIVDEVIVRGGRNGKSVPAAAGIPPSAVENLLLLDYGTPESLQVLRERAGDLAAVLVEPVQSRHPDLQPREFLREVRKITAGTGTALVFDEVITGFRLHSGGAQAWFDVRADLATYGKVVGGGLPIGIIAGSERFMDALDGGFWSFGDASTPEAGVTYFAGTFVRHPLALAAAHAVLNHLEEAGQSLYDDLNARTARLVRQLNDWFAEVEAPLKLESCGSLFKAAYTREIPFGELLYTLLRLRGIHIWDARPCFLTTAHGDEEVAQIVLCFQEAVRELQDKGFYPAIAKPTSRRGADAPPTPGARLGKDLGGRPAWFVPDPERPGKYLKVGEAS